MILDIWHKTNALIVVDCGFTAYQFPVKKVVVKCKHHEEQSLTSGKRGKR
jgi:hypothetical protein